MTLAIPGSIGHAPNAILDAFARAPLHDDPFDHLCTGDVLPPPAYDELVRCLPPRSAYDPFDHPDAVQSDGSHTRFRFPLTSARIETLPDAARSFWRGLHAWCLDPKLQRALFARLRVDLESRFHVAAERVPASPSAFLFKDLRGYRIRPHQDTAKKAVTVQIYLPRDDTRTGLGTTFLRKDDGRHVVVKRLPYRRNYGYAFAVTPRSWHAVEPLDEDGFERDSLMVIYYLDAWDGQEFSRAGTITAAGTGDCARSAREACPEHEAPCP